MRLIDCTLRDGGYHNSWNFSKKFAEETISNLISAGVDNVEIGFRKPNKLNKPIEGIFANLDCIKFQELQVPPNAKIGLMINAADYLNELGMDIDLIKASFPWRESGLTFIRIAADRVDIPGLSETKTYLESLGYEIHLNLMRINEFFIKNSISKSGQLILEKIEDLKFQYLTLADTYGVMRPRELKTLITECLQIEKIQLGLHMHDNLGLATSNSILGLDLGVAMMDSTITGMGRGPGNLRTEFVIDEISYRREKVTYKSKELLSFAARTYEPLKEHYKWGDSAYYNLGAKNLIHPTYIQYMTQKDDYSAVEIIQAINFLGMKNEIHFSEEALNFVLANQYSPTNGIPEHQPKMFSGITSAVILGAGDTLKSMMQADHHTMKGMENLPLISLTLRPFVDRMLIDAYIISDPIKYLIDYKIVESHESHIVTPFNLRHDQSFSSLNTVYPFMIKEGRLDFNENMAVLPFPSSLGYGLMTLVSNGVSEIKLAGFDGYEDNDPRHFQNQTILDLFKEKFGQRHNLTFLTQTRYKYAN